MNFLNRTPLQWVKYSGDTAVSMAITTAILHVTDMTPSWALAVIFLAMGVAVIVLGFVIEEVMEARARARAKQDAEGVAK